MSATAFAASGLHRSSSFEKGPCGLNSAESDIPLFAEFDITCAVNHDMVVATGTQDADLIKDGLGEGIHVFRHECFSIILHDACSVRTERDETKFHFLPPFVSGKGHVTPQGARYSHGKMQTTKNVIYILKVKILQYFYFH